MESNANSTAVKVNVLVVHFGSLEKLTSTIEQYSKQSYPDLSVHVYSNSFSEKGANLAHGMNVKTFLGQVGENVGYGQAINRLLAHIGRKKGLYIFANDDVTLKNTTVNELVHSYYLIKKLDTSVGPVSPNFKSGLLLDYTEGEKKVLDNIRSVSFSPGAFWLVDEDFLYKVGGFHPYFFMYGEDRELINRSIQSGFTPYQIASCTVVHDFDYPPKSIELRRNYHENTMATVIISPSSDHRVLGAFKGLVLDAIKYKRFYEVIEISLALIRVLSQYSKLKMQQVDVNNQTRYRFLS